MRLIDVDELIKSIEQGEGFSWDSHGKDDLCVRKKYIDNAPTIEQPSIAVIPPELIQDLAKTVVGVITDIDWKTAIEKYNERPQGEWNKHTIACLLADLFGDPCACNYCGIDEWLPKKCDFANKECPNVVGVACWEQFLKYRKGGAE